MARQTLTLACTASAFVDETNPNVNKHGAGSYNIYDYLKDKCVLLGFEAFPDNLRKKIIYSVDFSLSAKVSQTDLSFVASGFDGYFDESTVTYNSMYESAGTPVGGYADFDPSGTSLERLSDPDLSASFATARMVVVAGVFYSAQYGTTANIYTRNAAAANRPVITIEYDDTDEATSKATLSSPANGLRMDPTKAILFGWALIANPYSSVDPFLQTSATFQWSSDGGTTWNDVPVTGNAQYVTIPANTFPAATITWRVTATDDRGATTTSETRTIITTDTLPTTTLIRPLNTIEAADQEILFQWSSSNASGTTPTSYQMAWREAAVSPPVWTYIEVPAGAPQYLMPANTFPSGQISWFARARNRDGDAGPWSSTGYFTAVGAPAAPIVTVEAVPFATIRWQADGQQAWRVTVDGTVYGPYFGTGKSFTLPDYLQDGGHAAKVEVQGSYGLWSAAGEVAFTVTNVPGDAIQLSGVFYRDAQLSWETESATADFLIYRDGVRIAHTSGSSFTDRVTLGQHRWQVINRLPGGFYTASNAVEGELRSCGLAVAPLAGGEWLELTKSASSTREIGTTISQAASVRHFAGEIWPSAEVAPYRDQAVSFDVAWLQREKTQAAAFEALIGQTVILKAPDGSCVVGLLSAVSRRSQVFFRAYTATVTRVKWRDYIDADR